MLKGKHLTGGNQKVSINHLNFYIKRKNRKKDQNRPKATKEGNNKKKEEINKMENRKQLIKEINKQLINKELFFL